MKKNLLFFGKNGIIYFANVIRKGG